MCTAQSRATGIARDSLTIKIREVQDCWRTARLLRRRRIDRALFANDIRPLGACSCKAGRTALLQSVGKGTRRAAIEEAVRSGCFEFEPLAEESDGLRESAVAEPEGALNDARFAADVARDVEGFDLAFA